MMKRRLHRCGVSVCLAMTPAAAADDLCGCPIGKSNLLTPGTATCEVIGASTVVSLTDNTVIEWDSFALRPGAELRFQFANPADTVVNRVTGGGVTFVGGTLQSNGNLVLLSPNAFLAFDGTARVTAASFTASGLDADPSQFFQATGGIDFQATPGTSPTTVIQGEITTTRGGVTLVGRELHVAGRIDAAGPVTALTGERVTLDLDSPRDSTLAGGRQIIQAGTVDAAGDITFISRNAISMTGRLSAGGGRGRVFVKVREGGSILTGAAGLEVHAGDVVFSEVPRGEIAFIEPEEGDNAAALAPAFNEFPSRSARTGDRTVPTSSTVVARAGSGFSKAGEERARRSGSRGVASNVGSLRKRSFFRTRTTVTPAR